jgi:hypothetical protein
MDILRSRLDASRTKVIADMQARYDQLAKARRQQSVPAWTSSGDRTIYSPDVGGTRSPTTDDLFKRRKLAGKWGCLANPIGWLLEEAWPATPPILFSWRVSERRFLRRGRS